MLSSKFFGDYCYMCLTTKLKINWNGTNTIKTNKYAFDFDELPLKLVPSVVTDGGAVFLDYSVVSLNGFSASSFSNISDIILRILGDITLHHKLQFVCI